MILHQISSAMVHGPGGHGPLALDAQDLRWQAMGAARGGPQMAW